VVCWSVHLPASGWAVEIPYFLTGRIGPTDMAVDPIFYRSRLFGLLLRINTYLVRWARRKYKRLRRFKRVKAWWAKVVQHNPGLFAHWQWTTQFLPMGW
jgi:RNA-directed DNA polymerase